MELEFDVIVQVYKDTGQLLDEVDATTGFEELLFTAPADGIYYFRIAGFDGSTGEYDVTLIGSDRVSWQNMTPDYVRE